MTDPIELVVKEFGCPNCGECNMDKLVWLDDNSEFVRCETCQCEYDPFSSGGGALSLLAWDRPF